MSTDIYISSDFYILDKNFHKIHALTQYESLMWVDKYDEPGSIEIYAPPVKEIIEAAKIGNYIQSSRSEHLMIIEKLVTTYNNSDGQRLVISGRSLESILDRRVIFMDLYMRNRNLDDPSDTYGADNLEDAVRQVIDVTFMHPDDPDRVVPNLRFEYSNTPTPLIDSKGRYILDSNGQYILGDYIGDDAIDIILLEDMEFNKGDNVLAIVETIVKSKHLGFKITLDETTNEFVFKLINGKDRTSNQIVNSLVEFSPTFNNLKDTTFTVDGGENYKNYIYTEGEVYKGNAPKIIETGDATGLERREYYTESSSAHETETSNVTHEGIYKEKKKLSEEEYEEVLKKEGDNSFEALNIQTSMESEVEPRLQFEYGRDFFIGDIVQIKDASGNTAKSRVKEFIISHSSSGYEEYPTFEDDEDEESTPSQSVSSGGDYTEEGKMSNDEIISEAVEQAVSQAVSEAVKETKNLLFPVGCIIESTTLNTMAKVIAQYGGTTWIRHTDYMLRGATSSVTSGRNVNAWQSSHTYAVGNLVIYNNIIYKCITAHTSGSSFTAANWSTANDGGADSVTVSSVASHNHTQNAHRHTNLSPVIYNDYAGTGTGSYQILQRAASPSVSNPLGTNNATATNIANGANYTVNTLPKYKNVYIWERTA